MPNLDYSVDSGHFSVRSYLPLILKDSSTHLHGLTVCMKEGLPFAWELSLENSADSYVFIWLYFTQYISSFSSIGHLFLSLSMVFDSIPSNIYEVLSINPSANAFVFGDFKIQS